MIQKYRFEEDLMHITRDLKVYVERRYTRGDNSTKWIPTEEYRASVEDTNSEYEGRNIGDHKVLYGDRALIDKVLALAVKYDNYHQVIEELRKYGVDC